MLLSHAALLHYQRYQSQNPGHRFDQPRRGVVGHFWGRTPCHYLLCGAAVITRILGKLIAVINALWILAWSLMNSSNILDTPYCSATYFTLHNRGWMRLWNFDPQQFATTKVKELGCLVFGSVIVYCACVLIFIMTCEGKSTRYIYFSAVALLAGFFALVAPLTAYGVRSIYIES
jgi:hypothetical protein